MSQPLHEQITYVIPTHNRPAFLRRLLHYLELTGERVPVRICDSSDPARRAENEAAVRCFSGACPLTYSYLNLGVFAKCRQTMEQIETPFTVFCADDDFLNSESVLACASFLERSPEYSCAQGAMISLSTGKQNKCYLLTNYSLVSENAVRRFRRFASNWYSTFYSVCRTPLLTRAYQVVDDATDYDRARILPEILLSQMTVILGQVKYLPGFYNLREEHDQNDSRLPIVNDLEHCEELYLDFRNALAAELSEHSGATLDHAESVVDVSYGYLRDGGVAHARNKRSRRQRVQREVLRHYRRLMSTLRSDQILQRRRLHMSDPLCRGEAFQIAHELMLTYPHGIELESAAAA